MSTQLLKLVQQASSDNPNEVANASKMAVSLMVRESLSFDDFLQLIDPQKYKASSLVAIAQAYAKRTSSNSFEESEQFNEYLEKISKQYSPSASVNEANALQDKLDALFQAETEMKKKFDELNEKEAELETKEKSLDKWNKSLKRKAQNTSRNVKKTTSYQSKKSGGKRGKSYRPRQNHTSKSNYKQSHQQRNGTKTSYTSKKITTKRRTAPKNTYKGKKQRNTPIHQNRSLKKDLFSTRQVKGGSEKYFLSNVRKYPLLTIKLIFVSLLFSLPIGLILYLVIFLVFSITEYAPIIEIPALIQIVFCSFPFFIWKAYQLMEDRWYKP